MNTKPKFTVAESLPLNTIIDGDCIEVMNSLPECSVDLIFADPPYDNPKLKDIPTLILKNETILNKNGLLILEHSKRDIFSEHINFVETRKYGNVNFSFFRK